MDRDLVRGMITGFVYALVLAAVLACQEGDRRESPGDVGATLPLRPAPIPTTDPDVRAAQVELSEGRPAIASKLVMPVLRIPERRTPEALLVGARAASEWGGWTLVKAMLAFEPWIDTRFGGEGRELLARSALERGDALGARTNAEAALRVSGAEPSARAVRLVLLARALDRLDQRDSAAATYRRAAEALPLVRDWLVLRAAGSTANTKDRERVYASLRSAPARGRIANTEAQALERFRMELASAAAYEKLGDIPTAYRLRLASDNDAASRSGLRAGLLGYIQRDARGDDLTRGLVVLDAAFPQLDPTSQLLVARRAAEGGVQARAASGFSKVPPAALTDSDVIAWGRALLAAGKPLEAAQRVTARKFGAAAAGESQYLRGLALVRSGRPTAARPVLQRIVSTYSSRPEAADALFLLADMDSDAGRTSRARDVLQQSCVHKPPGSFSDEACFRSGILSYALGREDARRAAVVLDELPSRFPASPELPAATYWAGRAWERAGNATLARERWSTVMTRDPLSYYAAVSAKRLGSPQWTPAPAPLATSPHFQPAIARAAALRHLGMETEEKYEYEAMEDAAGESPPLALAAGAALLERGEVPRAIRLGWRVVGAARTARDSSGRVDERGYGLIYPLLRGPQLLARSRANNLDAALVAAVIRQESSWNPNAVSRAGARGLMQLMPRVGEAIARGRGWPVWDDGLLFDPDVSLDLGTSHLRAALSQYRDLPRALAAYNAGASRVQRWMRRTGARDPELFIEQIPFVETRDYVRIVLRNAEMYRALHGLRK